MQPEKTSRKYFNKFENTTFYREHGDNYALSHDTILSSQFDSLL